MKLDFIDSGNEFDFGNTSENYSLYRDIYPKSMYEKLIEFGIGKKGQSILDLGSGTSVLPINMYHTGAKFISTDISQNQIEYGRMMAKSKGFNNTDFKVCSAEDTGFDDNSFDVVTAVQCFQYFKADVATKEIKRILKPNGLFCKIFMDWLPYEDDIIKEMEELVLKYSPQWSGYGFKKFRYNYPKWADNGFDIQTIHSYNVTLQFTKEAWIGRIKSCRGVGASLSKKEVEEFENEYRQILNKYDDVLNLKHQIHIEIYKRIDI